MGHYCRLCHRHRPNEAFSGRGHRTHVCKRCQRRPHSFRELDEVTGFLSQSNISAKNIRRLEHLSKSPDVRVRERAAAILEMAQLYPRKRERYVRMAREQPLLLERLRARLGHAWWDALCLSDAMAMTPAPCDSRLAQGHASPACNGLKRVTIYTDGACQDNPGPGGWAAILRYGKHVKELKGGEPVTTNNRMELQAAIAALGALKQTCAVDIFTDSKYLRDGISKWLARWKSNGWQTLERTPVKNKDLWMQLDALCTLHQVRWEWLKGHAGHRENERCDQLARAEIAQARIGA